MVSVQGRMAEGERTGALPRRRVPGGRGGLDHVPPHRAVEREHQLGGPPDVLRPQPRWLAYGPLRRRRRGRCVRQGAGAGARPGRAGGGAQRQRGRGSRAGTGHPGGGRGDRRLVWSDRSGRAAPGPDGADHRVLPRAHRAERPTVVRAGVPRRLHRFRAARQLHRRGRSGLHRLGAEVVHRRLRPGHGGPGRAPGHERVRPAHRTRRRSAARCGRRHRQRVLPGQPHTVL